MKLQKTNIVLILSVLIGLSFTSCDEWDYYTRRATLDINPDTSTSDRYDGSFSFFYDVFDTDISDVNLNREELIRGRLNRSELWVEGRNIYPNDILRLSFEADGWVYDVILGAQTDSNGSFMYIDERDPQYAAFMARLIDRVIQYRSVRLYVEGEFEANAQITFKMTIKNDIEVDLRN